MSQAAITALIAAIEAGDEQWVHLPRIPKIHTDLVWRAHQGSLDAALALHKALLPGWLARPQIGGSQAGVKFWHCTLEEWDSGKEIEANNVPCPARAWLIAILKAYQAQTAGSTP